jgi:hypothetical protein
MLRAATLVAMLAHRVFELFGLSVEPLDEPFWSCQKTCNRRLLTGLPRP